VFESLKHLDPDDIHTNYSDEKLVQVIEEIKQQRDATARYQEEMRVWKKYVKGKRELTDEENVVLLRIPDDGPEEPQYPHGCVNHIICDDLLGSSAFKSTGKSALTNLVLRNRHLSCNIHIATQSLKSIPKSMRNNTSLFVLFKFANKRIVLEDLYDEVSGILKPDQFEALYDHATENPHDSLVLDLTGGKPENRIRKNYATRLLP
jgi:hypothetical protein